MEKTTSRAKDSQSFTMNLFRGVIETAQVFPFPQVLNEEQKDTLKMFIDPTAKFFEVCICVRRQYLNLQNICDYLIGMKFLFQNSPNKLLSGFPSSQLRTSVL